MWEGQRPSGLWNLGNARGTRMGNCSWIFACRKTLQFFLHTIKNIGKGTVSLDDQFLEGITWEGGCVWDKTRRKECVRAADYRHSRSSSRSRKKIVGVENRGKREERHIVRTSLARIASLEITLLIHKTLSEVRVARECVKWGEHFVPQQSIILSTISFSRCSRSKQRSGPGACSYQGGVRSLHFTCSLTALWPARGCAKWRDRFFISSALVRMLPLYLSGLWMNNAIQSYLRWARSLADKSLAGERESRAKRRDASNSFISSTTNDRGRQR